MKLIKIVSPILVASTLIPASVHAGWWESLVGSAVGTTSYITKNLSSDKNGPIYRLGLDLTPSKDSNLPLPQQLHLASDITTLEHHEDYDFRYTQKKGIGTREIVAYSKHAKHIAAQIAKDEIIIANNSIIHQYKPHIWQASLLGGICSFLASWLITKDIKLSATAGTVGAGLGTAGGAYYAKQKIGTLDHTSAKQADRFQRTFHKRNQRLVNFLNTEMEHERCHFNLVKYGLTVKIYDMLATGYWNNPIDRYLTGYSYTADENKEVIQ